MNSHILKLLEKYLDGTATPDEIREVDAWYDHFENKADLDLSNEKPPKLKFEKTFLQDSQS